MTTLQLCLSTDFETLCQNRCGQRGSFVLISTDIPSVTEDRLNGGWTYPYGPRKGSQSPPLAYAQDWRVFHQWLVTSSPTLITNTPEFRAAFGRPCMISEIEKCLMKDDSDRFPELGSKGMSKNGLDNVFVLRPGTYLARKEAKCSDGEYQQLIRQSILDQVQGIIEVLEIEDKDEEDERREEAHVTIDD